MRDGDSSGVGLRSIEDASPISRGKLTPSENAMVEELLGEINNMPENEYKIPEKLREVFLRVAENYGISVETLIQLFVVWGDKEL